LVVWIDVDRGTLPGELREFGLAVRDGIDPPAVEVRDRGWSRAPLCRAMHAGLDVEVVVGEIGPLIVAEFVAIGDLDGEPARGLDRGGGVLAVVAVDDGGGQVAVELLADAQDGNVVGGGPAGLALDGLGHAG
jgi:hypothetical protein